MGSENLESVIRFKTKFAKILHDNDIKQNQLFETMSELEIPNGNAPVSKSAISNLANGKQTNCHITTWQKIIRSINYLSDKKYQLADVMPDSSHS